MTLTGATCNWVFKQHNTTKYLEQVPVWTCIYCVISSANAPSVPRADRAGQGGGVHDLESPQAKFPRWVDSKCWHEHAHGDVHSHDIRLPRFTDKCVTIQTEIKDNWSGLKPLESQVYSLWTHNSSYTRREVKFKQLNRNNAFRFIVQEPFCVFRFT